jgi:Transcriptional regulatory protein, C terminal
MTWLPLSSVKVKKSSQITFSLSMGRGSNPKFIISATSVLAASIGLEKSDHVSVMLGSDEHAGKMMVVPDPSGAFKIAHMKHCVNIRVDPPSGLAMVEMSASIDFEKQSGGGLVFSLPEWAIPGGGGLEAPSRAAQDKPGALEINGNTVIMGAKELKLTKQHMHVFEVLHKYFGKCVAKTTVLDHLYQLDPDGGAQDKIVDVYICKLRAALEGAGMPLAIITHRGTGYELRRATT